MFTSRNNPKQTAVSRSRSQATCRAAFSVLESLESRQHLNGASATITPDHRLAVIGDGSTPGDQVDIRVSGSDAVVTDRGVRLGTFGLSSFTRIDVDLGWGDDSVRINSGLPAAVLIGSDGNDTLHGGDGNDTLWGDSGVDDADYPEVTFARGNDELRGHGGSDRLTGGPGADKLDGGDGPGVDLADYSGRRFGVTVTFDGVQNDGGTDEFDRVDNSCENVIGGSAADLIDASVDPTDLRANTFWGGGGNDTIRGGFGNDTLFGEADNDSLTGGSDQDRIYGGDGNDTLNGNAGGDVIYGEAGDDLIFAADTTGFDWIDGGDGSDTAYYDRSWIYANDSVYNCESLHPQGQQSMFPGFNQQPLF